MKKIDSKAKKEFVYLKEDSKAIFGTLFKVSALFMIIKDIGSWFEYGYLSPEQADMIRSELKRLLEVLKKYSVVITDYFIP